MSVNLNRVILMGRTGSEPEMKVLDGGMNVATLSFATSEFYKDRDGKKVQHTEWHNLKFWGEVAKNIEKYVHKGDELYIEGAIRYRSYEKDGEKKYFTEINVTHFQFGVSAKKEEEGSPPAEKEPAEAPKGDSDDSDDLPF